MWWLSKRLRQLEADLRQFVGVMDSFTSSQSELTDSHTKMLGLLHESQKNSLEIQKGLTNRLEVLEVSTAAKVWKTTDS